MATAPVKHNHDEPAHKEPAKVAGQPDSLILPEAEPALGEPLIGARGVKGEHIEDGERDPDTIAEEQRRRSDDYVKAMAKDAPPPPPETRTVSHPPPKK